MAGRKQRQSIIERVTKETQIKLKVNIDGHGRAKLSTGIPFLEHMLTLMAAHGKLDLTIAASGDLEVDQHHLVEDIGIALGQAIAKALGDKKRIVRYGWCVTPMDESLVHTAIDISGRPYLAYNLKIRQKRLGSFDTELVPEFFRGLTNALSMTLHIDQRAGGNSHHLVEAAFKGIGRALRQALAIDPREKGVPSTKGLL